MKHRVIGAVALTLIIATGGTLGMLDTIPFAWGQTAAKQPQDDQRPRGPRPTEHIEGKLAFLKTELKITPAQETQWEHFASVLRENATKAEQAMSQARANRAKTTSAIQRLQMRASMEDARAAAMHQVLDAAQPLYATFNDDQKKAADALLTPHHGWGGGPMHP